MPVEYLTPAIEDRAVDVQPGNDARMQHRNRREREEGKREKADSGVGVHGGERVYAEKAILSFNVETNTCAVRGILECRGERPLCVSAPLCDPSCIAYRAHSARSVLSLTSPRTPH